MIAGKQSVAAASKVRKGIRRALLVINRCSPLVKLWANPRLRLLQRVAPAAFTTSKTVRKLKKFLIQRPYRGRSGRRSRVSCRGYHTGGGVSNEINLKNR